MTETDQKDPPSSVEKQRHAVESRELSGHDSVTKRAVLRWIHAVLAIVVLCALVATNVHAARNDLSTITLLRHEVATLDALYGLALSFLAIVTVPAVTSRPARSLKLLSRLRRRRLLVVCGGYLTLLVVVGSIYPLVAPEPVVRPLLSFQPPVWSSVPAKHVPTCHGNVVEGSCQGTIDFPLGTGHGGKNLVRVTLLGLNTTLRVAVTAAVLALVAGVGVGTAAGYLGGWKDELLMRYVDLQRSLPSFFVYILLVVVFEASYPLLVLVFGFFSWGGIARQIRSEVVQRKEESFVKAARLSGAGPLFVIRRHVLPNASSTVVTVAAVLFAKLVVFEASLAFLTLTDTAVISLGNQLAGAVAQEGAAVVEPPSGPPFDWGLFPWVVYVPGGALCSLLLATGILTDGLRDELDPRS